MQLTSVTVPSADVRTEAVLLVWQYTGGDPREVIIRADLGTVAAPLGGQGGGYEAVVYVNDVIVSPSSAVLVRPGSTRTIIMSRAVPLNPGDTLTVAVKGQSLDLDVGATVSVRDASVFRPGANGSGSVPVDHNYGGDDRLAVKTPDGVRVGDATIRAYPAVEWQAGNRANEFVVAATLTDVFGRWREPLLLDPGAYTLLIFKTGAIRPRTYDLTVA